MLCLVEVNIKQQIVNGSVINYEQLLAGIEDRANKEVNLKWIGKRKGFL